MDRPGLGLSKVSGRPVRFDTHGWGRSTGRLDDPRAPAGGLVGVAAGVVALGHERRSSWYYYWRRHDTHVRHPSGAEWGYARGHGKLWSGDRNTGRNRHVGSIRKTFFRGPWGSTSTVSRWRDSMAEAREGREGLSGTTAWTERSGPSRSSAGLDWHPRPTTGAGAGAATAAAYSGVDADEAIEAQPRPIDPLPVTRVAAGLLPSEEQP